MASSSTTEEELHTDTNTSSELVKKFLCKICEFNFLNQTTLLQHVKAVHASRPLGEVIELDTESDIMDIVRMDEGPELCQENEENVSELYLCSDCGEIFVTEEKMEEHCRLVHPAVEEQKRIFECSECNKRYETEQLFYQHNCEDVDSILVVSNSTEKMESRQCETCTLTFASKYALNRHLEIVHGIRGPAAHSGGKQRNSTPKSADLPTRRPRAPKRTDDGSHRCGRCSETFDNLRALKNHAVTVHKMKWNNVRERTPQTCSLCNKTFSSTGNLNKHLRVIHRRTPKPLDIQTHVKRVKKERQQKEIELVIERVDSEDNAEQEEIENTGDSPVNDVQTVEEAKKVSDNEHETGEVECAQMEVTADAETVVDGTNHSDAEESSQSVQETQNDEDTNLVHAEEDSSSKDQDCVVIASNVEISEPQTESVDTAEAVTSDGNVEVSEVVLEVPDPPMMVAGSSDNDQRGYILQMNDGQYTAVEVGEIHMIIEDNTDLNKENLQDSAAAAAAQDSEKLTKKSQSSNRKQSSSRECWLWYCHSCPVPFTSKDLLIDHHRQLHLPENCEPDIGSNQQCEICLKLFSTKGNRDKHVNAVHRIDPSRISAETGAPTVEKSEATRISCDHCEKSFRQRRQWVKHVQAYHPEYASTVSYPKLNVNPNHDDKTCEICGKQFPNVMKKEMHVHNHNRSKKIHKCLECDKTFNRIDYLREHVDKTHGVPKFKCSYCPKRFVRRTYLNVHERIHTNERPYGCDLCGKAFKQWGGLYQHKRFHFPKPPATHFCKHCHKGYSYKSDLDRHLVIHSDRKHVCSYCSRPFPTASQLTVHIRTHTGQRPYKCGLCSMCFMTMGGLKRHQQIHERREAGSFICGICGASYRRQSSMDEHIRVFHRSEEQCIEEQVGVIVGENVHEGEDVIEFIVQEDGTVTLSQGGLQVLKENHWVETTDLEKELVEGIFASQAGETTLPVISVTTTQENDGS